MATDDMPLALFKANAELQIRIARLVHESIRGWLGAAQSRGTAGLAETAALMESLLGTGDWRALMSLPAKAFSHDAPNRWGSPQALTEIAIKEQIRFTNGLQEALITWQQGVIGSFQGNAEAAPFVAVIRQWGRPWTETVVGEPT